MPEILSFKSTLTSPCAFFFCTDVKDDHQWSGHFSECPDKYINYCVHGSCRFVQEQNTPTCRWVHDLGLTLEQIYTWNPHSFICYCFCDYFVLAEMLISFSLWHRCETGYIGARCEYYDMGWLVGEQREIVIISIVSGLVIFLLIIVFICVCTQWVRTQQTFL